LIIAWQIGICRCNRCWATLAPSLRGLSKIYLIFDWGSVLKKDTTLPQSQESVAKSRFLCQLPQRGSRGRLRRRAPSGRCRPRGATNSYPKQLDKLQFIDLITYTNVGGGAHDAPLKNRNQQNAFAPSRCKSISGRRRRRPLQNKYTKENLLSSCRSGVILSEHSESKDLGTNSSANT